MNLPTPPTGTAAAFDFHDAAVRVRGEHAGAGGFAQTGHLPAQLAILLLKVEDAGDAGQIDALVLAELLRVRQTRDVAQGVAAGAAVGPLRHHEPETVVLAEGLRVDVGQFGGAADREHWQLDVEPHLAGTVKVRASGDQRHGAHLIQLPHLLRHPCHDVLLSLRLFESFGL